MSVIDELYGKNVQKQAQEVLSTLELTHKQIIEISKTQIDFFGGKTAKNPKELTDAIQKYEQSQKSLEIQIKKNIDLEAKLATSKNNTTKTARQLEQQSIKESNARNSLNKQREQSLAAIDKENAKLLAAENFYNKLQSKLNSVSNEYKNLSAKKEFGISLTAKEEQRYTYLQGKIQSYDKTLKAVDGTMGKHQRNVGNYASGFNPLNNSIAQLGREMPAFANSVQTGFMAISNNLPIFFDAMGNVIAQNKKLQEQGQPTKSVLSQLASGLFSFQTLLSVGVTLLTVYGKEIVEWVTGLTGAEKSLKQVNLALIEISSQSVGQSKDLDKYRDVVVNTNLSEKERLRALKLLKEQIPELSKVELNHADAIQQVNKYTEYYIKQAAIRFRSDGFIKKAGEELIKQEEIRLKLNKGQVEPGFTDYLKALRFGTVGLTSIKVLATADALRTMNEELQQSIFSQKEYEKAAEIEIKHLDLKTEKTKSVVKQLQELRDLEINQADYKAKDYELKKLELTNLIENNDKITNNEKATTSERIQAYSRFYEFKKQLALLDYDEQKRITEQGYKDEKQAILNAYNDQIKEINKGVINGAEKRKQAVTEKEKALLALEKSILKERQINNENFVQGQKELTDEWAKNVPQKIEKELQKLKANNTFSAEELKGIQDYIDAIRKITTDDQLSDFKDAEDNKTATLEKATLDRLKLERNAINESLALSIENTEEQEKLKSQLIAKDKEILDFTLKSEQTKADAIKKTLEIVKEFQQSFIGDLVEGSGFSKMFDILNGGLEKFGGNAKATALAVSDAFQQAFNTIIEADQESFDLQYENAEKQYQISTAFAGDSAEAKKQIDRQYEDKKREIKNREAKADKDKALFNIAINTAQAIVAALPNVPLSVSVGFLGALQYALVANKEIPKYAKGGLHDGGLAMINDAGGSNYVETVVTPDGKAKQYKQRNAVLDLPKGTEIFTPEQWALKQSFEMMPLGYQLNFQQKNNSDYLTDIQVNKIVSAINQKPETSLNFDNGKFQSYVKKGHQTTIKLNNRLNFSGNKV
jgi:hypothetical protein